ncbi:MAG: hypothetical protein DYH12_11870 [Sorangiineae bacterium PRO1]|nr:hypothetical protein [Sorangiineae bacterium PRO1]
MTDVPAPLLFVLRRVVGGETVPAVGEVVNLNHLPAVGDVLEELRLARDQAAIIQDDEPDGNSIIICDATTGRRVG